MARKKKQTSTLHTPDDAKECMKELKALTIQMQMIENDTNLAVLRIQEESRKRLDPLAQQRNALEHDLKLYVEENQHLFARVRQIVREVRPAQTPAQCHDAQEGDAGRCDRPRA